MTGKKVLSFLLSLVLTHSFAQQRYNIQLQDVPPINSIRGMSVVNDSVIWLSGTGGKVGRTTDAGIHWNWLTVPGYDSCDWRSLLAFSDQRALLLNAGEPASLLLTTDGGINWQQVYYNNTKGIFFDGITFRNLTEGIAIGDPMNGKFTIIRTTDSGRTWFPDPENNLPAAKEGEAIFAASGTSLRRISAGEQACFITGGTHSRFFKGWQQWQPVEWPFIHGRSGTGAFSVAFRDKLRGVAVGGDYMLDTLTAGNCMLTRDGGRSWQPAITPPKGYRSCVQYITNKLLIATGTSGTDISEDGGLHWFNISQLGFHVAGVTPNGKCIWLAGSRKLGKITLK
jgi:photosystem II stability/assembly factor-like uncharacterized protein